MDLGRQIYESGRPVRHGLNSCRQAGAWAGWRAGAGKEALESGCPLSQWPDRCRHVQTSKVLKQADRRAEARQVGWSTHK